MILVHVWHVPFSQILKSLNNFISINLSNNATVAKRILNLDQITTFEDQTMDSGCGEGPCIGDDEDYLEGSASGDGEWIKLYMHLSSGKTLVK